MKFRDLSQEDKASFYNDLVEVVQTVGGQNFFLQILESIREEKIHPLLNKSKACRYTRGRIKWEKSIYKDTLDYIKSIIHSEDLFKDISEKEYKKRVNLMKTLKPLEFILTPTNSDDGEGFSFKAIEMIDEKNSKFSTLFKIIFFYDIDFTKKVLSYKAES
jgi:hypothetical protein